MKKLLVAILIMASITAHSQANFGIQIETHASVGIQLGYLQDHVDISIGYKTPVFSAISPSISNISLGYQIGNGDYKITPSIGAAHHNSKKLVKSELFEFNSFNPIYSIEVGKDIELGRFIATVNYCKSFYAGVGIKCFIR